MNQAVAQVLKDRLERLEWNIKWEREKLSDLAVQTASRGKTLDRFTAERRAIQDALDVA
jgi:hypothetical protein